MNRHQEHCDNKRNQWQRTIIIVKWKSIILKRLVNAYGLDGVNAGNRDLVNEYDFVFWDDKNALKSILTMTVLALWIY